MPSRAIITPEFGADVSLGRLCDAGKAKELFDNLREKNLPFEREIFRGKPVARGICAFGDPGTSYKYSQSKKLAPHKWDESQTISEIKRMVEKETGENFNYVHVNEYRDGSVGLGWHADDEEDMLPNSPIASVSFGAPRFFTMKNKKSYPLNGPIRCPIEQKYDKTKKRSTIKILLEPGSLLLMKQATQKNWEHCVAKVSAAKAGLRYNLTFRQMKVRL